MSRPTIVLVMIVKNEEKIIENCLRCVLPHVDAWCIVDTGSSDRTKAIIIDVMKDKEGSLYERPWKDFAHNRTEALELAKDLGDYTLMLDADDEWTPDPGFEWPDLDKDSYEITIRQGSVSWPRVQVMRTALPWRYEDEIHEHAECDEPHTKGHLEGVLIVSTTKGSSHEDSIAKYSAHAIKFEAALEKDPNNPRYAFYLAQSYRDSQQTDKAIAAYEHRVRMGGWAEEVWYSLYQIGILHLREDRSGMGLRALLDAYRMRPTRVEPLVAISQYYRTKNDNVMAHPYACAAKDSRKPDDRIFVDVATYSWRALDEYAITCFYVGKYRESQVANEQLLLKAPPDQYQRIVQNLVFCQKKLAPTQVEAKSAGIPGRRIVVTGCGRSGSGYVAKVLAACGLNAGHEAVFGPWTRRAEWKGWDADVSWLAVPWLSTMTDELVVHLIRDPVECARSTIGIGFFDDESHPLHGPYLDVIARFCPGVLEQRTPLARFVAYYTVWNETVVRHADMTIRIEDLDESGIMEVMKRSGRDVSVTAIAQAMDATPQNYNTRKRDESVTMDQLHESVNDGMRRRFNNIIPGI